MPKMKTKSGAKKRFVLTGTGKVKRRRAFHRHILTKKSAKRKRNLRGSVIAHEADAANIRAMIPYA
jgi:large subunit ribosomal protein L35